VVPQKNRRIKEIVVPELDADHQEYSRIVKDMARNAGDLAPDPNWLVPFKGEEAAADTSQGLEFILSDEAYGRLFSKMSKLMPAWIGEVQLHDAISKYRRFLEGCDLLGLWDPNVTNSKGGRPLAPADLGSIMDLNLLYAFTDPPEGRATRILEVGGGYGRLAEAAFNIFGRTVKYVLVDAVPASLYYSRQYLSRACPDARIWSFYDDERAELELDDFDIAIIPAWHFETLSRYSYDVCVNIESMQEMNQHHVDYYLGLFQSVAASDATIYLSNARGYYFQGSFNYPANWRKLFESLTPRSWKQDHPTEIFRKTSADCSRQNRITDSAYKYGLWLQKDPEEFVSRNGCKDVIMPLSKGIARSVKWRSRRMLRHQAAS
jgi:SAM-dependent methyltransferase